MPRPRHSSEQVRWSGAVAVILALGVTGFILTAAVGISVQTATVSEGTTHLLSTVLGGMVGALATYLGMHLGNRGLHQTGQAGIPDQQGSSPTADEGDTFTGS